MGPENSQKDLDLTDTLENQQEDHDVINEINLEDELMNLFGNFDETQEEEGDQSLLEEELFPQNAENQEKEYETENTPPTFESIDLEEVENTQINSEVELGAELNENTISSVDETVESHFEEVPLNSEEDLINMLGLSEHDDELSSLPDRSEMEQKDLETGTLSDLQEETVNEKGKKKKVKEKKAKEKKNADKKKGSFFAKLFSKKEEPLKQSVDENDAILKELSEKEEKSKKASKTKKSSKTDGKQKKEKSAKREKKVKKPKKVKPERAIEPIEPAKPLPKIPVIFTVIFSMILLVIVIEGTNTFSYSHDIALAKRYYEHQNYKQAYEILNGVHLKGKDKDFFQKLKAIILLEQQYQSFLNFTELKMYDEALNSLLKGLRQYDDFYTKSGTLGISKIYDNFLNQYLQKALVDQYKLSLEQARELNKIEDKEQYTFRIEQIIGQLNLNADETND